MYQNFDSCQIYEHAYIHQIVVNVFAHGVCVETGNFFRFSYDNEHRKITLNGSRELMKIYSNIQFGSNHRLSTRICITLMLMMMMTII